MLCTTKSIKLVGIEPVLVTVECQITPGLGLHLVGIVDSAVKESLLRTVTAMQAHGYKIPGRKIVINLAPADLHKSGSIYDLAIALSMIAASFQKDLPGLDDYVICGELGLDGSVRGVCGAVQAVLAARENGFKGVILPEANLGEIAGVFQDDLSGIHAVGNLTEAINVLTGENPVVRVEDKVRALVSKQPAPEGSDYFNRIGSASTRRALEITAAGGHNLLVVGSPQARDIALARALSEIMPPMTKDETIESAKIYSASGTAQRPVNRYHLRPFRIPHYHASLATLLGGGAGDNVRPGEVTLANGGVLWLEDFNMFPKNLAEALRGPVEDKKVILSRLKTRVEYPADFILVATMNPCPCGHYGNGDRCTCSSERRIEYLGSAFSGRGPLFDTMGVQLFVRPDGQPHWEDNREEAARRVEEARQIQAERFKGTPYRTNNDVPAREIDRFFPLSEDAREVLERVIYSMGLSARSYSWIVRIARTIADLDGQDDILACHICEATSFRFLDRKLF